MGKKKGNKIIMFKKHHVWEREKGPCAKATVIKYKKCSMFNFDNIVSNNNFKSKTLD